MIPHQTAPVPVLTRAPGLVALGAGLAQLTIPWFGFTYIQEKLYLHIFIGP